MVTTSGQERRPTRVKIYWLIAAIILWLIFAVISVPAIWGAYAMTRGGQLALSGVSGTLWRGQASLASFKVDHIDYSIGQLYWTLKPWSLLRLQPCATIVTELERQQIQGEVCAGHNGELELRDADISAPAALLQPNLPLPIDGQLSIHIARMQIHEEYLRNLSGSLSWRGARIHNGKNWMSLGSFAAELTDDTKGGISAKIFQLEGPIEVDMQVNLAAGGGGSAVGSFTLNRAFSAEVQADAWLSMFAQAEATDSAGNTRYRVDFAF